MQNTVKTLALIKVMLDHNPNFHSYLDIFVPLLLTLLKDKNIKELKNIEVIRNEFEKEYGLNIPYHPMLAIVNKAISSGYGIEVSKGRFVPVFDKINSDGLNELITAHDKAFQTLIAKYISFASEKHGFQLSEDKAYEHFMLLLKDHDLDIVFANDEGKSILPLINKSVVDVNLAYDFVRTLYEQNSTDFQVIADVAFGHIIASSLLFGYEVRASTKEVKVNYYLDTGILFGLFGINGDYEKIVYAEFIKLINENCGNIFIFNHTYDEFVNIVEACKYWIDSPSYDPYKASRTLIHFKTLGYHITDIDLFISKIPKVLKEFGIEKADTPDPNIDNHHQMSEVDFQKSLIEIYKKKNPYFDEEQKEGTIYLDVRSVSAIYKQRKGRFPRNIEECGHLFVTRNATLAFASILFEKDIQAIDRFYIPTTVTDVFLGTMLWLNAPIKINLQEISTKRLVSHCYAALQPTKQQKKLFLAEIKKGEADKLFTDDEIVLLKTSNVAQELLQEKTLGDPNKINTQTPIEIMEQIRAREKTIARKELESAQASFDEEKRRTGLTLQEKDELLEKKQQEINDRTLALNKVQEDNKQLINSISRKVKKNANIFAWIMFATFIIPIILFQLIDEEILLLPLSDSMLKGGKITFLVISLLNLLANFNFLNIKNRILNHLVGSELKSYGIELPSRDNILEENR